MGVTKRFVALKAAYLDAGNPLHQKVASKEYVADAAENGLLFVKLLGKVQKSWRICLPNMRELLVGQRSRHKLASGVSLLLPTPASDIEIIIAGDDNTNEVGKM